MKHFISRGRVSTIFLAILGIGTAGALWQTYRYTHEMYQGMALQGTSLQVQSLQILRELYTTQVVKRVGEQGIQARHDFAETKGAIPLPATFTMEIGAALSKKRPGAEVRLYSDYPFPWRQADGGPRDDFEHEALAQLRRNPSLPFFRFEEYKGRPSLRYATADLMQADCISCHNTHPDSPKRDWKVGDVRGVLEFVRPLDDVGAIAVAQARSNMLSAFGLTCGVAGFGLLGLAVMVKRLRSNSEALVRSSAQTNAVLQAAFDGILTIDDQGIIISSNTAAEQMFGYDVNELTGRHISAFVPLLKGETDCFAILNTVPNEDVEPSSIHNLVGLRKSGGKFPIEIAVSEVRGVARRLLTATVRDITRQKEAERALTERSHLAAMEKDVGIALTRGGSLQEILLQCSKSLVHRTDAAFARIWTVNDHEQMLELQASAGLYTHIDGGHARVPIGKFKIGLIAQEREPHLTNDVQNDPRVGDHEWARREGMVAFAGHPLMVNDRLVGVMALFARRPLSKIVLEALSSVADAIAVGIQRKRAESQLESAHRQLMDASRQAGMAEIATGVLHNVGNVLNSVNVSSTMIADTVRQSRVSRLVQATDLIRENTERLDEFLTTDEKGKQLPGYLIKLAEALYKEQKSVATEIDSLTKNIEHIKTIVSTQQEYAHVSGVTEAVNIREIVEDALRMSSAAFDRHHIEVVREHGEIPSMILDRQKLLQIMVNLIRNAKHAICDQPEATKRLTIRTGCQSDGRLLIEVIDSGVGIAPENLTRIFAHGFTTKKNGHGFGLHSSALAAKELGGTLHAHSEGIGLGARFVIDLPVQLQEQTA